MIEFKETDDGDWCYLYFFEIGSREEYKKTEDSSIGDKCKIINY